MSTTVYVGLGSNMGDRRQAIRQALDLLGRSEQIEVLAVSDIIETSPLGGSDQPEYINAVCQVRTTLNADSLHSKLREIESALGRVRQEKWGPRTIDLDLLLFGDRIIHTPDMTIPHPQIHLRSFVLKGLAQLDPGRIHPVLRESVAELAVRLNGGNFVIEPTAPQLVCIAGTIGVGKTTWAKRLAEALGGQVLFEPYDTNPFLPEVYAGKRELGLDSQLYFLVSRAEQLSADSLRAGQLYFADYLFEQEQIYARRLLDPLQLGLYQKIYPAFPSRLCPPMLVLFLQDSVANCLDRINRRNRSYERGIQASFLQALADDYQVLFGRWTRCPVIRIRADQLNCLSDGDVDKLSRQIVHYVKTPSGDEV